MKEIVVVVIGVVVIVIVYNAYKKPSTSSKGKGLNKANLVALLDKMDESYIRSHQERNVTDSFFQYASDKVVSDVMDDIIYGEEKLFGTKKYRMRTWQILEDTGYFLTVRKLITHRHIKVNRSFNLSIGEDIDEIWRLRKEGNSYRLIEILPQ